MTARVSNAFKAINTRLGKDPAVSEITVTLDPNRWSARKKNLIIKALQEDQVTSLGYHTSELVDDLLYHFGGGTNFNVKVNRYGANVPVRVIQPDMLEDCIDHLNVIFRLRYPGYGEVGQNYRHAPFAARMRYVNILRAQEQPIFWLPLPDNQEEAEAFARNYVLPKGERERKARHDLAEAIRVGEPLTITTNNDTPL